VTLTYKAKVLELRPMFYQYNIWISNYFYQPLTGRSKLNSILFILQIEVDPNQLSKSVIIISDGHPLSTQDGYINKAFEDGPQKADKVNDKHNVRINIKNISILPLRTVPTYSPIFRIKIFNF